MRRSLARRLGRSFPASACAASALLLVGLISNSVIRAAEVDEAKIQASRKAAITYLVTAQADDGSWTDNKSPGITGLVTTALLQSDVKPDEPAARKALKFLASFIKEDGGIYASSGNHGNYETSISLMAFQAANQDGRYNEQIAKARDFVKKIQWDDESGINVDDIKYGGAGYGRSMDRPDLSNTVFLLDALRAAGVADNDPAFQKALVFVSRCQNLESQSNTTPFASKVNDGGFYYTPAAGGSSPAGKEDNGGLRSYGSMTYTGLRSMIYAGVGPDDPRVKAATQWIKKHYTLEENPGMGQGGLYYYYHTYAKALDALKSAKFVDGQGVEHTWKRELAEQLLKRQKENGSWVNSEKRWMEGDPNLVTAYALLTLAHCQSGSAK